MIGAEINRIPSTNDENHCLTARPLLQESFHFKLDSTPNIHQNENLFENKIKYSKKRKDLDDFQPISAISPNSQKLLKSPRKAIRKIPKSPFKVLDAPDLQDDFYLNLVDWSSTNVLSVGLGSCVYLWSAHTSQVRINKLKVSVVITLNLGYQTMRLSC